MEIDGADRATTAAATSATAGAAGAAGAGGGPSTPRPFTDSFGFDDSSLDTNTLLNQLLAEVSSNVDEQGPWSQWWPPMEEVELPVPVDENNMPMLL